MLRSVLIIENRIIDIAGCDSRQQIAGQDGDWHLQVLCLAVKFDKERCGHVSHDGVIRHWMRMMNAVWQSLSNRSPPTPTPNPNFMQRTRYADTSRCRAYRLRDFNGRVTLFRHVTYKDKILRREDAAVPRHSCSPT
jgi:hypothetical protein